MADDQHLDLTYGHLGQSVYDPQNKAWLFSREPGRNRVLKPLGSCETAISASSVNPESSHEIDYSIRRLARAHPEIVPAISILPSCARLSEAVTDATSIHDPTISTRLAIGEARDLDNQRSGLRTVPILAIVSGSAGQSLRLLRVEALKLGWETQESLNTISLRVPDLKGGEGGWWQGAGGPIKQVYFVQNQGRGGSWLAVRQLNSTTIMRPLYHRIPVFPSSLSKDAECHPPSRINANAIVTLTMDRTGGRPHADVTFNPWYNRQFAIVDQGGHWSVWGVEGARQKRSTYRASLEQSGSISHDSKAGQNEQAPTDGWGSVSWVEDAYTLAVFGRRDLAIFDLRQNPALRLQVPDLGLSHGSRWILDVKASPANKSHLFIVTTSQLFWLQVTHTTESNESNNEQYKCRILLSWRHSRYEEDTSLQLNVLLPDGDSYDTLILLYSRLTDLVTVFQFAMHPQQPNLPLSPSDPYKLEGFPDTGQLRSKGPEDLPSSRNSNISNLLLLPVRYVTRSTVVPKGLGRLYQEHDVKFYTLLVLGNDLSLRSRLYSSGVPKDGWDDRERDKHELVKRPNISSRRTRRAAKSTTWVTDERFVVEDEAVEVREIEDAVPSFNPQRSKSLHVKEDPWTLNWEWLYKLAFLDVPERDSGSCLDGENIASIREPTRTHDLTVLGERLRVKRTAEFQPIETMLELYAKSFQASDTVQLSSSLNSLMDSFKTGTNQTENQRADSSAFSLTFRSLLWPLFPGVSTEPAASIATSGNLVNAIQNHLSQHWLTPIRDRVSEELYASNEQVTKQIAGFLLLASIGVQLHQRADNVLPEEPQEEGSTKAGLPRRLKEKEMPNRTWSEHETFSSSAPSDAVRRSQTPNRLSISASQPTPSRLPSARPSPSRPSSPSTNPTPTEDTACIRLRAYTTVKPQPPLPSRLSKILTDWAVGVDPAGYSWEASQRAMNRTISEDEEEHQADDIRAQRRERDRRRRQSGSSSQQDAGRRNTQIIPRMAFSSQGVSSTTTGPPELRTEGREEEAEVEEDLPMTQVERGPYGGRQPAKKKRKRREAGF